MKTPEVLSHCNRYSKQTVLVMVHFNNSQKPTKQKNLNFGRHFCTNFMFQNTIHLYKIFVYALASPQVK